MPFRSPNPPSRWSMVVSVVAAAMLLVAGIWALQAADGDDQAAIAAQGEPTYGEVADSVDGESGEATSTSATGPAQPTDMATTTDTMQPAEEHSQSTTATTAFDTTAGDTPGSSTTGGPDTTIDYGEIQDPPVTTMPLPADRDVGFATWDYDHGFGAVQQWIAGGQDCIRLYSPIRRDPALSPSVTLIDQVTIDSCVTLDTTDIGDWYVDVNEEHQIAFLRYAAPPTDLAEVWITDITGYEISGFLDSEFWGFDNYWYSKMQAVHFRDIKGGVTSVDLPDVARRDDILRLYIGRPIVLG